MSKAGNAHLRAAAYRMAIVGIQHNPVIAAHHARKRAAGKSKMNALGRCMRKVLSIVWGVWSNGQDLDPNWGSKLDRTRWDLDGGIRKKASRGRGRRGVADALRDLGAGPIDGVKAPVAAEGVTLSDAKMIVGSSSAWPHLMPSTKALREAVAEAIDLASAEDRQHPT